MVRYDAHGICDCCGLPGAGFVEDDFCVCLDYEDDYDYDFGPEPAWTDEDEAALEEWEEQRRVRIAEENEY